jgi:hypothetical protein
VIELREDRDSVESVREVGLVTRAEVLGRVGSLWLRVELPELVPEDLSTQTEEGCADRLGPGAGRGRAELSAIGEEGQKRGREGKRAEGEVV